MKYDFFTGYEKQIRTLARVHKYNFLHLTYSKCLIFFSYLCFLFKGSGEAGRLLVGGAGGYRFRLGGGSTLRLWFGNCRCRIHGNLPTLQSEYCVSKKQY